jgi:predicted alpha/beta hydrolase
MKGSVDVEKMDKEAFERYLKLCSLSLARGHARTGSPTATFSYIGSNETFAKAIGRFALRYADQTEADYQALVDAAQSGRVEVESGI